MAITLSAVHKAAQVDKVIIHSIDLSMYQASVIIDDAEHYVSDNQGKLLRTFNLLEMQKRFRGVNYQEMTLRHQSAYDEMVGHCVSKGDNTLEVALRDNFLS